jgi:hypothetical protein
MLALIPKGFEPPRPLPRRPPLPHGHPERSEGSAFLFSPIRALRVPALSPFLFPAVGCELSTACPERSRRVNSPPLSPFPATLMSHLQIAENKTTLSSAAATLTRRVMHNPFVCHSYKKHRGWGHLPSVGKELQLQSLLFNFQLSTVNSFRPSSVSISLHGIYTPFVFILLRTLLHCQERYLQSFHIFPHSLHKTPGVGVWSPGKTLFPNPNRDRRRPRQEPPLLLKKPQTTFAANSPCPASNYYQPLGTASHPALTAPSRLGFQQSITLERILSL